MKKISISLIFAALMSVASFAQISVSSASQQMIEKAVRDGIVLMRQDYQLQDTVSLKRFTLNNQAEFGSAYTFCVKTETGYIVSAKALTPWEGDPKFDKYRNSQYRPILSKTYCKSVSDEEYQDAGLASTSTNRMLANDTWTAVVDTLFNNRGFVVDSEIGPKDGWLVWLSNSSEGLESGSLSIATYRYELTLDEGTAVYEIPAPSLPQNVVGGIYIEPRYQEIGKIEFDLVGVVVRSADGWQLVICAENIETENSVEESSTTDNSENADLTVL